MIHNRQNPRLELPYALARRLGEPPTSELSSPLSELDFDTDIDDESRRLPEDISEEELIKVYKSHRYEIVSTAKALNLSRASLYNRIQSSPNLRVASNLTPEELRNVFNQYGGDIDKMVDHLGISKSALRRRLRELGLKTKPR